MSCAHLCVSVLTTKYPAFQNLQAANFVLDSNSSRKPCLVDFGLAKLWIDRETGKARKPSTRADFRGSASWASANAYTGRELGRHDDLWSLLYVLVDFVAGTLPWKELVDHHNPKGPSDDRRGTVEKEKNRCRKDPSTLIAAVPEGEAQPVGPLGRTPAVKVPSEIAEMSRYLDTLEFDDTPDYDKLRKMFSAKLPVPADAVLLDWEQGAEQQRARWEGSNNGTYAGAVTGGAQMPGANGHPAQPQPQGHGQPGHASQGHAQHGQRLRELPKLSPAAEAFIDNANKYTAKYNDMMLSSDPRVKWFGHTGKSAMEGIGVLANDYGDDVDVLKSVHTQLRQLTADLGAISEEMDMWLRGAHGGVSLGMRPHVAEASRQAAHAAMVGHGHHGPSPGSHPNADARRRDERAHAYDRWGPSNRRDESRHGGAGHGGGDEWRREGGRSGGQQRQYGPNGPGGYSDRDHDYDGRRDDREYYRERERSSWYDDRDRHRERERDERMRSSSHPHSRGQGSGHAGGRSRGSGGGRR